MSDELNDAGQFGAPALAGEIVETEQLIAQISILAKTQCDLVEAASYLNILPDQFERFLATHARSAQAWFSGAAAGRAGLRMAQFQSARNGSSRLLVWLGKQHLGQTEGGPVAPGSQPQALTDAWDNLAPWRMRLG